MSKSYKREKQDDRFVSKLRRPGGITPAQAIAKASECLETAMDSLRAAMDERIAALPVGAIASDQVPAVYGEATEIFSLAATVRFEEMALAARSLCDLIDTGGNAVRDGFRDDYKPPVLEVVQIHLDTMRMMNREDMRENKSSCQTLVAGLQQATNKFI